MTPRGYGFPLQEPYPLAAGERVVQHDCLAAADTSNECFGGCTEPLTFSECVLGCGSANAPLLQIHDLASADCESDPARSCLQLHAAALGSCTEIGAPAQCALACLNEAVCLDSCLATADCERYAAEAYALCLAGD